MGSAWSVFAIPAAEVRTLAKAFKRHGLKEATLEENERFGIYMSGYAVALLGERGEEPAERALLERVGEILEIDASERAGIERQCREALAAASS